MREREQEILNINKGMHQVNEIYKVSSILFNSIFYETSFIHAIILIYLLYYIQRIWPI